MSQSNEEQERNIQNTNSLIQTDTKLSLHWISVTRKIPTDIDWWYNYNDRSVKDLQNQNKY